MPVKTIKKSRPTTRKLAAVKRTKAGIPIAPTRMELAAQIWQIVAHSFVDQKTALKARKEISETLRL
jgi:hypothetical protein